MRVAAIQMNSRDDLAANLAEAEKWVVEAAELGCELVALPENFAYMRREGAEIPCAQGMDGEIVSTLRRLAGAHRLWLLGGSFPERIPGEPRVYNTSLLLRPNGKIAGLYRKIHLFDVDLRERGGGRYQESKAFAPGRDVVVAETPFGGIGLSICYDLRFPELYRAMTDRGVRWIAIPAAFARETGRDHWELLVRARAVENQAFVVAAAQWGECGGGRASHGRSLIVDPWGVVLACAPDAAGLIVADCELERQERIRRALPVLSHRRLPTTPSPQAHNPRHR